MADPIVVYDEDYDDGQDELHEPACDVCDDEGGDPLCDYCLPCPKCGQ